jgi:activator of HSP90 ATPase
MTKDIRLTRTIKATPEEIYIALTNPFSIELWSGEPAVMSTEVGTEFSMLDGEISGINLEFRENEFIKQMWFFGEDVEDSIVTITLEPEKNNTKIFIEHKNIPAEAYENMMEGWKEYYLGALKTFFELKDSDV